ncbi:MAG: hypothetical protein QM703_13160 [Gemmatales bacterium]
MSDPTKRNLGELILEHVRIFQRGKIWWATYQHEGKQVRTSLKTRNKIQARKEGMKIELQLQDGSYQEKIKAISSAEAVKLYLKVKTSEVEKGTVRKYTRDLHRMLEVAESLRRTKLNQIDLNLIDAYKLARGKLVQGVKGKKLVMPSTVFKELMIIRGFVNWCLTRKLIKDDPLTGFRMPQPKTADQPWWTWDVVHEIIRSIPKTLQAAFAILAFSGMRYGEVALADMGRY